MITTQKSIFDITDRGRRHFFLQIVTNTEYTFDRKTSA